MHRIPRFFTARDKKHKSSMDSKQKGRGTPKLDRRLARKNIDYEPSTSSSLDDSSALRTRSLDLSPLGNRTSFRIQGIDGEFDEICRSLGLSGPDDFSIPTAAWEARKVQSSLDFPGSRLQHLESPRIDTSIKLNNCSGDARELSDSLIDTVGVSNVSHEQNDTRASVGVGSDTQAPRFKHIMDNDVTGEQCRSIKLYDFNDGCEGGVDVCGLSDRLIETVRVSNVSHNQNNTSESVGFAISVETSRCGGGGGIKGVRPPVLAPPPSYLRPAIDDTSSTWDIFKSFAPVGDGRGFISLRGFRSDDGNDNEEEVGEEEDVEKPDEGLDGARLGETVRLSESCSFTTTSNDDDSSSTTTDPTSNISPNDRFRRIISHWEKGELLGRGSFGSVYEGIADGGFFIAVKEVSLLDQGDLGRQSIFQLEQEIALLSQFQHENIVQYYGTDKDESNLYIFLELVTKGSLLQLYQKYHLQDSTVSSYTRQILHGLKYLHERNVVHRDIKCANILVDANGSVKLADFGLAKVTKLNDVKSCKGTPFWMAPEVVKRNNQGYGLAADIWSLGCTVLEMLTRQIPYSDLESMQALFRIGRGVPPLVPDSLSADARDFVFQCLQVNSSARPTASQLLDHPFVKRPLSISSGSSSPYSHRV